MNLTTCVYIEHLWRNYHSFNLCTSNYPFLDGFKCSVCVRLNPPENGKEYKYIEGRGLSLDAAVIECYKLVEEHEVMS